MLCYFQGCKNKGTTKEHIPPKSFFPRGEKNQLLTVRSCEYHNNAKSQDDQYVLAQICMNASPSNRAREVFLKKIRPQLNFNDSALRGRLAKDAINLPDGSVKYSVEMQRFDEFFTALSCGVVFKSYGAQLPERFDVNHIYPNFTAEQESEGQRLEREIVNLYSGEELNSIFIGKPNTQNERIYSAKLFGLPEFQSSITIVHLFIGKFKVVSMLHNNFTQGSIGKKGSLVH